MAEQASQGRFRDCRVIARTPESRIITSFLLEPVDAATWQPFDAGQFLVLRVPATAGRRAMPRSYSVSSSPAERGRYRISVKREAAPNASVPDGAGSCWLHDDIKVGDVISVAGPRGEFFLDRESQRPAVLLSGGVGLTPMVSMLHTLSLERAARPVHFIHACDNGDVHALRDEVLTLSRARAGIDVHFCYRFPTADDRAAQRFHSEGVLTQPLLDALLPPLLDRDYYLCGPPPFMKAVFAILRGRGVPRERIRYEFFGPATVLEEDVVAAVATSASPAAEILPAAPSPSTGPVPRVQRDWLLAPPASNGQGPPIEFRKSGVIAAWDAKFGSLLEFAEANGVTAEFSCRAGVCGTCRTRLITGDVVYTDEPLDPPAAGEVLICCAKPHGPVVLDV